MIQYRYQRSEGSGFGGYISEKDAEKAEKYTYIFDKLRAIVNQKEICFTYLAEDGMAYFMQTEVQTNANSHGMVGEISRLPDSYPVEYLNKIGSSYVNNMKLPLNDERLPTEKNRLILGVARELQPVFAEIVDTILYTNKKIILIANDSKTLQNYLFVISLLLPKDYMKHVGFIYNAESMPYILSSGSPIAQSIRIIATKEKSLADFGGEDYYVADVTGGRPILPDTQLHIYGKLIKQFEEELKRGSASRLSTIIANMRDAFNSDGSFDKEKIDVKAAVIFYEEDTSPQTAKMLLKARLTQGGNEIVPTDDVINAIIAFLGEGSADAQTEGYITRIRSQDAEIDRVVTLTIGKDALIKINDGETVTSEQIKTAGDYLCGEQDADWQETFNTINERFSQQIFELLAQAYIKTKNKSLLARIADYCRVANVVDNIDEIDDKIFDYIVKNCDDNIQLLAAVLFSAYFNTEDGSIVITESRPARLQKYINEKFACSADKSAEEQNCIKQKIDFLLTLKKEITSVYKLVIGRDLPSHSDFNIVKDDYIRKLIDKFDFNMCFEYYRANDKKIAEYVVINSIIIDKLTNADMVEREVENDSQINLYEAFLDSRDEDYHRLKEILKAKKGYNEVKDTIFEERSDYTIGLYKCMPLKMRTEVARIAEQSMYNQDKLVKYIVKRNHDGIDLRLKELREGLKNKTDDTKKLYFEWRAIIDSIVAVNKKNRKKTESSISGKDMHFTLFSLLKSFFCALIAVVLLCIVPVVGAYLAQENFIDRLGDYLNIFHLVAVLWAFIIHFILRMRAYKKSNKGGSKYNAEVRMVWYYTFLTVFLPILLYIVSYIIYATCVPSDFSF